MQISTSYFTNYQFGIDERSPQDSKTKVEQFRQEICAERTTTQQKSKWKFTENSSDIENENYKFS